MKFDDDGFSTLMFYMLVYFSHGLCYVNFLGCVINFESSDISILMHLNIYVCQLSPSFLSSHFPLWFSVWKISICLLWGWLIHNNPPFLLQCFSFLEVSFWFLYLSSKITHCPVYSPWSIRNILSPLGDNVFVTAEDEFEDQLLHQTVCVVFCRALRGGYILLTNRDWDK